MPELPPILRNATSGRTATGSSGSVNKAPVTASISPGHPPFRAKRGEPGHRDLDLIARRCAVRLYLLAVEDDHVDRARQLAVRRVQIDAQGVDTSL